MTLTKIAAALRVEADACGRVVTTARLLELADALDAEEREIIQRHRDIIIKLRDDVLGILDAR